MDVTCTFLTFLYRTGVSSCVNQKEPKRSAIREQPRMAWSCGCTLLHEKAVNRAMMLRMTMVESLALCLDVDSLLMCASFSFLLLCICDSQKSIEMTKNGLINLQSNLLSPSWKYRIIHTIIPTEKVMRVLWSIG